MEKVKKQNKNIDAEIKELEEYIRKHKKAKKPKQIPKEKHSASKQKEQKEMEKAEEAKAEEKEETAEIRNEPQKEEVKEAPKPEEKEIIIGEKIKEEEMPKGTTKNFELEVPDAKQFVSFIESASNLVEEGNLRISKNSIEIKETDPAAISMVKTVMPSKFFLKYDIEKEGNIGINLKNLATLLKGTKNTESIVIKSDDKKLKINLISADQMREIEVPIYNVQMTSLEEPKINFDAFAEFNAVKLKQLLARASKISNYISIAQKDGIVTFTAKSDAGSFKEDYKEGDADMLKKAKGEIEPTTFNLEYLKKIVKNANKDSVVRLNLKSKEPVKVEYSNGTHESQYWLAPYIEE
ncbi:MAG: hypothetical protein QXZ38_04080 [Candidatus Micrarchaeaceae archaeon]